MQVKEESEKVVLKLNIQKTKIIASSPITSWQIEGEQWKQCQTLLFWAPKSLPIMTAAVKRCSLLGRKVMTNLDSILKSRDITLQTKVHQTRQRSSQSYGFSSSHVWMQELDYKES